MKSIIFFINNRVSLCLMFIFFIIWTQSALVNAAPGDPPLIAFTWITSPIKQSNVPASIKLTITDDEWISSVTFNESWTTNSWIIVGSWGSYDLSISNSIWLHEYSVSALDGWWNASLALIIYNVIANNATCVLDKITSTTTNWYISWKYNINFDLIGDNCWDLWNDYIAYIYQSPEWKTIWTIRPTDNSIRSYSVLLDTTTYPNSDSSAYKIAVWCWWANCSESPGYVYLWWSVDSTFWINNVPLDTTPPLITYTWIISPIKQSEVPVNISLTITDDSWITPVTFYESWTTNSWTLSRSWDIYFLPLSNSLWVHDYIITVLDWGSNTISEIISYNVVPDDETLKVIYLKSGWNLLTLPSQIFNSSWQIINHTAETFWQLAWADVVTRWKNESQQYESHLVWLPANNFDLTNVWFFIHVSKNSNLALSWTYLPYNPIISNGWNMIWYADPTPISADNFWVSFSWNVVSKFNNNTQQWESHIVGVQLNDFTISQWDSVFLHK
ncbi:MAG: hypothetical protein ACD_4C00254G0002 [uncultured bacterium (gcode 4)]|uniref:Uncharacterized protein n=1 Tax=uncultured bacterium (gcode 4) TaxID=1234023 RepID=K2GT33_9BACT|nr:MAG: hypothetical protein ACD_4C00254G0002 [uncultured bacterium (gcode 4)]